MENGLLKRFSSGVAWTLLGNLGGKGFAALSAVLLARILGPHALGEYGIIVSTVTMFSVYAAFRMGNTAIIYVSQYKRTEPVRAARVLKLSLTVSLILCMIVALAVLALSHVIAEHNLKRADLADSIALGSLLVFFLTYGNILQQALTGFENFRSTAIVTVVRGVLTPIICVPMAYFWGVNGAVLGLALVAACVFLQIYFYLKQEQIKARFPKRVSLREACSELPILWKFALPGFLVLALITAATWLAKLMLTRQEGGFSELGIFEAAGQWTALLFFMPWAMARVILPILSDTDGRKSPDEFQKAFSLQFRTVSLITLPLSIFLIGVCHPLVSIYGAAYRGTEKLLPLLVLACFLRTLNESVKIVYESKTRQWINCCMYAAWALTYLAACAMLLPRLASFGFALAALIAELTLFILTTVYLDFVLIPAIVRRHSRLLGFSLLLLSGSYWAQARLPWMWSLAVCSVMAIISTLPLIRMVRGWRSRSSLRSFWLGRFLTSCVNFTFQRNGK